MLLLKRPGNSQVSEGLMLAAGWGLLEANSLGAGGESSESTKDDAGNLAAV